MINALTRLFSALTTLWGMGLAAAWAAAVVFLLRLVLKRRAPRQVSCLLWLVVFARLLLPFSPESPVSAVPHAIADPQSAIVSQKGEPAAPADPQAGASASNAGQQTSVAAPPALENPNGSAPQAPAPFPWQALAAGIWLAGLAAMLCYTLVSYLLLRRRVFAAVRAEGGAWEHPNVTSPFLLGLFRPRIYLPLGLSGQARAFILCHERAHIRRRDYIVKPICWLALILHWFNPAAWLAFLLLGRDMEAACDEAVLRQLGPQVKAGYSAALLGLAAGKRFPAPVPLAFGHGDAKSRIKSILHYKKPALWVIIAAVLVAAVAAICLLTDPVRQAGKPQDDPPPVQSGEVEPTPAPDDGPAPITTPLVLRNYTGSDKVSYGYPLRLDLDGDGMPENMYIRFDEIGGGNTFDVLTVCDENWQPLYRLDTMGDMATQPGAADAPVPTFTIPYPSEDPNSPTPATLTPLPDYGAVLVECSGLSALVPVSEEAFAPGAELSLGGNFSNDYSLISDGSYLYVRRACYLTVPASDESALGYDTVGYVEFLCRLWPLPGGDVPFLPDLVSIAPALDEDFYLPALLADPSAPPASLCEGNLTLLAFLPVGGAHLADDLAAGVKGPEPISSDDPDAYSGLTQGPAVWLYSDGSGGYVLRQGGRIQALGGLDQEVTDLRVYDIDGDQDPEIILTGWYEAEGSYFSALTVLEADGDRWQARQLRSGGPATMGVDPGLFPGSYTASGGAVTLSAGGLSRPLPQQAADAEGYYEEDLCRPLVWNNATGGIPYLRLCRAVYETVDGQPVERAKYELLCRVLYHGRTGAFELQPEGLSLTADEEFYCPASRRPQGRTLPLEADLTMFDLLSAPSDDPNIGAALYTDSKGVIWLRTGGHLAPLPTQSYNAYTWLIGAENASLLDLTGDPYAGVNIQHGLASDNFQYISMAWTGSAWSETVIYDSLNPQ